MTALLKWKPEPGRQGATLKAAGLKAQNLRDVGFRWGRGQEWEADDTPAARAVLGMISGQIQAPANDNLEAARADAGNTVPGPAPVPSMPRVGAAAIAKARKLADHLDLDAAAGERPRDMGTPKRMAQAMSARVDAAVYRRAAVILRAWADAPERLPTWKPSRKEAEAASKRKLVSVPNGWHSYHVETSEPYPTGDPLIRAIRAAFPEGEARESPTAVIERLEAAVRFSPIPGFFPTPPSLIRRVIELADIRDGQLILEPSAGSGHLAEAARALGAQVHCCEVNSRLREILTARGLEIVGEDCLAFADELAAPTYRRIVMNPPFEQGQDRQHIHRMFDLLHPGGRLVAVCSTGPFHRTNTADSLFRDWLAEVGAEVEDVEPGAFAGPDAFRKTGVAVKLITIDKEA